MGGAHGLDQTICAAADETPEGSSSAICVFFYALAAFASFNCSVDVF